MKNAIIIYDIVFLMISILTTILIINFVSFPILWFAGGFIIAIWIGNLAYDIDKEDKNK